MNETIRRLLFLAWAVWTPGMAWAGGPAYTWERPVPERPMLERKTPAVAGPEEAGPRIERFALFAPAGGDATETREVLGLVEWRCQTVAHGLQLQRDVHLVEHGREAGRVMHIERLTDRDARLVWREIGSASGRSLLVEWARDERGLRVFEWGRDGTRRVTLEAWKGVALPLYLIELTRFGRATQGSYVVFDPLGRRLETVTLRTSYSIAAARTATDVAPSDLPWSDGEPVGQAEAGAPLEPSMEGATRTVELVRRDGTLAGRYVFRGVELVSFQLQAGGAVARRVSAKTYARLLSGVHEAERASR